MTETVCWKLLHSLMLWIGFSLWWPAHFGKAHFWTLNRLSLQTPFTIQLIHEWKDVIANLKHEIGASAFNANVLTKIIPLYSSRSHRREALHSLTTLNLVFHSGAYNEFPIKEEKKITQINSESFGTLGVGMVTRRSRGWRRQLYVLREDTVSQAGRHANTVHTHTFSWHRGVCTACMNTHTCR